MPSIEIDHVLVCMPDLDESVRRFEDQHRIRTVTGGRHEGHGTANRLVPLGTAYLELITVVDEGEASTSPLGRWVTTRSQKPGADAICLRTDDLDAVCERLELSSTLMARLDDQGRTLTWRTAGLEVGLESGLPFFVQWEIPDELHPARIPIDHPGGPIALEDVVIHGDEDRLSRWTEGVDSLTLAPGEHGVSFALVRST